MAHATIVYLYLSYVGANKHRAKQIWEMLVGVVKLVSCPDHFLPGHETIVK